MRHTNAILIFGAPTKTRTWDNGSEGLDNRYCGFVFYTVFYHKMPFRKTAITLINKGFHAHRLNKKHHTTHRK